MPSAILNESRAGKYSGVSSWELWGPQSHWWWNWRAPGQDVPLKSGILTLALWRLLEIPLKLGRSAGAGFNVWSVCTGVAALRRAPPALLVRPAAMFTVYQRTVAEASA